MMKKNRKIIYSENQTFYLILIPFLIIILLLVILSYFDLGNKPIPIEITFTSVTFFIIIILLFYKMSVKINKKQINISFGIGIIKKKILISDINFDNIEKLKINWYYGIGIRMIKNGWLYNTKIGEAIKLEVSGKEFAIGTENYDTVYNVLQRIKKINNNIINNGYQQSV
jgi:hypothetical protein